MELKDIQSLIKFVSNSSIDEVSVEKKDFKISIKRNTPSGIPAPQMNMQQIAPVQQQVQASAPVTPVTTPAESKTNSNLIEIKSPMIGTFYRRPSPDKQNFVEVGDELSQGQVICIIEAMKLFNEIEAEISGKVVKVLVDDSEPVEYDQPLFLVEPA